MKGERGFQRYYAFLSLFTMSMLGLVVATNIFQMYLFWELVGVSSYLPIGFYYTRPAAIAASKKAFIVTRFADLKLPDRYPDIRILRRYFRIYSRHSFNVERWRRYVASGTRADVCRRCRQECHVPVAYLVTGRHGRSDSRQCTDSCRHHGSSRRLPCGHACSRFSSNMLRTYSTRLVG